MQQSQQQNLKMVFVLMVSAVLCAVATFVAIVALGVCALTPMVKQLASLLKLNRPNRVGKEE